MDEVLNPQTLKYQLISDKPIHFQVDKRVLGTAEEKQAMPEETPKEEKS